MSGVVSSAGGIESLLQLRRVEEFLFHEARLIDERRFEDWRDLFTEDGIYWVPAEPGQDNPVDRLSIFYENRELMDVRIRQLRHNAFWAQIPPVRTRHVIGNVVLEEGGGDAELRTRSSFVMLEYRDDRRRVFGGETRHRLRPDGDGFRIARKRVDIVDCDGTHGFMSVPF